MPPGLPAFPLINGNRYDYTSLQILINAVPYRGIKAIDYSDSLDPKKVYGTSARAVGRTRGPYDADGSVEVFKEDAVIIRAALAALGLGGWMEANFIILVAFSEPVIGGGGATAVNDQLLGCRVKKASDSHSQGSDPITEKWDLDIMDVIRNGVPALSAPQYVK